MNLTRKDLIQSDATMNQMRNMVYHLERFMKINGISRTRENLRRMGRNIARTYTKYWTPIDHVNKVNVNDVITTIYKKILNSSVSVELDEINKIVMVKDNDCSLCKYQFKDIEVPGVFHGMATTEAAVWLQKLWNRNLSDVAEFNRTMARGKWKVPRGSKLEVTPDDSHGQMLLYNPVMGLGPEMMDIKGLPATYTLILEIVVQSLMELYHQHEVTQGTNRSDLRSGEMVSLLLEQDDFGNVPTHAILEESLEAVMKRVLGRIQKGYKNDRVISISGRDLEYEIFDFKGANLRDNTDVVVAKESSIPDSKVARQLRIKENYGAGLYGDPADPKTRERVLRMLDEVPDDIRDIFQEAHLDRQNAKLENRAMISQPGIQLMLNPYDDHGVHLEEHRMQKKQPEYQKLKFQDPESFAALEITFATHERLHQAYLAKEAEAEDARMAKVIQMKKGGAA